MKKLSEKDNSKLRATNSEEMFNHGYYYVTKWLQDPADHPGNKVRNGDGSRYWSR